MIEDLTSLAELYLKAKHRSGLDKTSHEIEDIEEEFAKAQEHFLEYLEANKDELSSQVSGLLWEITGLAVTSKRAPTRDRPQGEIS